MKEINYHFTIKFFNFTWSYAADRLGYDGADRISPDRMGNNREKTRNPHLPLIFLSPPASSLPPLFFTLTPLFRHPSSSPNLPYYDLEENLSMNIVTIILGKKV